MFKLQVAHHFQVWLHKALFVGLNSFSESNGCALKY